MSSMLLVCEGIIGTHAYFKDDAEGLKKAKAKLVDLRKQMSREDALAELSIQRVHPGDNLEDTHGFETVIDWEQLVEEVNEADRNRKVTITLEELKALKGSNIDADNEND